MAATEDFQTLNVSEPPTPTSTGQLKLRAAPNTDIWRIPPSHDVLDAPIVYKSIKASSFRRARVTVSAQWRQLYDQGGLLIALPGTQPKKWVKAGTEMWEGKPQVSVVAADRWADWSLLPQTTETLTVEFERKAGTALWISVGAEGEVSRLVRQVTWVFEHEDLEMWIGVYAAKPDPDRQATEALEVQFSDLVIETV